MFIEHLQRHLTVCGQMELDAKLDADKDFWHVVSIREHHRPRPSLRHAKRSLSLVFDDREDAGAGTPPTTAHMRKIFELADGEPSCPLLIQCWLGWSRSTAVALAILVRGLVQSGVPHSKWVDLAASRLLEIRPPAKPNSLVLRLGLEQFLPAGDAGELTHKLVSELRILNRPNTEI